MLKFQLSLGVLFFCPFLLAQPYSRQVEGMPVEINSQQAKLPFAGGVNSPNHQFVDIDSDGDLDLFILDVDAPVEFYRNEGTRFAPDFKLRNGAIALPQISRWFLFNDIDGDGLLDLLKEDSTLAGLSVYKNNGTPQAPLFSLLVLQLHDSSGATVFAGQGCIPALIDIDNDSDYDFFSSNYDGTVNFYENNGSAAFFSLVYRTGFWQRITIYGDTCTTTFAAPAAHGASAFRFADINGNGTADMFIGDLFSNGIFFLLNIGTPAQPHMVCNTSHYPPNQPVITAGFNQPLLVDIDGDGDLDMFAGVLGGITQRDGFLFYQNIGSASSPLLRLQTKNFLPMIDVGMNAHPTFVDIDADGKQDMFVGNLEGALTFLRNIGTPTSPSFRLVDSVYQNITGGFSFAPAFADIDSDGRRDLFIGMYNGRMKFYRNVGTAQTAMFALEPSPVDTVNVFFNAAPAFVDIDNDSDLDLFVGKIDGRLSYYRNEGSPALFRPALQSLFYQNIIAGVNSFPTFTDIDNDGDFDLFLGTSEGRVEFYENIGTPTNAQFVRRTNRYANTEPMLEAAPAFVDIDNDGDKDFFVGTQRGGIQFYRNQLVTSTAEEAPLPASIELMQNYPNPFNSTTYFEFRLPAGKAGIVDFGLVSLRVFDVLGREVATLVDEVKPPGSHVTQWDASGFASGVYFYKLITTDVTLTRKLLLLR